MNKIFVYLYIFSGLCLFHSCASSKTAKSSSAKKITNSKSVNQVMIYTDMSGKFSVKRTMKFSKNKVLFQKMIYEEDFSKFLERSRSVTQVSKNDEGEVELRPQLSQFKGWFEGVEYSNQIKVSPALKQVKIDIVAPGKNYQKSQVFNLPPEDKKICFFHMIPECIKLWGIDKMISGEKKVELWFYAIMDSYPFLDLIYSAIPNKWVTEATLSFEGMQDKEYVFSMELHDQAISLKYNQNWEFIGMFWVSQNLSMVTN